MDDKLKGFFDTATQKAEADAAARKAADDRRAAEATARTENGRLLDQQIDAEIGGILFILKNLPEKDGKRFETRASNQDLSSGTRADRFVNISYQATQKPRGRGYDLDSDGPRPTIGIKLSLDSGGKPSITLVQYAIMDYEKYSSERSPRCTRCDDYDTLRKALGEAVAHIAASRLQEIGEAMGAQAAAAVETPAETSDQTRVFARPLQFKNAAQPEAKAEPQPAPEKTPEPAPAKPLWQRLLRL